MKNYKNIYLLIESLTQKEDQEEYKKVKNSLKKGSLQALIFREIKKQVDKFADPEAMLHLPLPARKQRNSISPKTDPENSLEALSMNSWLE